MQTVIIFGGSRGIGEIIANHFISKKIKLTVCARNTENLKVTGNLNIIDCDVVNINEIKNAFLSHKNKYGEIPEIIINSAGVQGQLGFSWEIEAGDFENTVKTNLIGSFNVAKIAVSMLIEEKKNGSIIMFSGGGSCYARPNFCSYGVSKTGVLRLVETIAEELIISGHDKIIINAIAPGAVKTRMTEEVLEAGNKAGKKAVTEAEETIKNGGTNPEQITNLVDFLSDNKQNHFISGRLIHIKDNYKEFTEREFADKKENGKLRRIDLL
jgi:NAD(P)-dependent dehydrogenase (short-subunit alcohol dehydrogenase family)